MDRRSGLARIGLVAAAALLRLVPSAPAVSAEGPRVLVNEIGLTAVPFGQPAAWQPAGREAILAIESGGADGPLVVLTDGVAYWLGGDGRVVRRVSVPRNLGWPAILPPRAGAGWTIAGAIDRLGRRLSLTSETGAPPVELRLEGLDAVFANVAGDEALEVVVRADRDLLVYDLRGALLRRIRTHEYVDDFWPVDVDASGTSEFLVYHYRSRKEGTYVSLVDRDGERLDTWHERSANRYSVCRWPGAVPQVVAVRDDVFTVRTARGAVVERFVVPGAGSFRYVDSGALRGGYRVLLARSGSCPSRLLVFDAAGRLVYDEVFTRYALLVVPGGEADSFFVAANGGISRYSRMVARPGR